MVKISRHELVPGDQIYSYRNAYVYAHHGIFMEDGHVIHYTRTDESRCSFNVKENCDCGFDPKMDHGVIKSCLECFLSGRKLRRVEYGFSSKQRLLKRSGTYYKENSDDAKTVLSRAEKLLKENSFGNYNLIYNNCESFARYCKTGNKVSKQAMGAVDTSVAVAIAVLL
ncbi:LRAT domain [Dillenia turbinata]|uniref:LRAT domain n=1 Tax=Dillenia turbinata TaxID=194707 RepID=A0AAN8WDD2_9MAGN